jgi:phospholipase/lecithinase/hemolysin
MRVRNNLLAFSFLVAAAMPAAALSPTSFVIFGDSLVDAGNIYAATSGAIPSSATGYVDGRFTNGANFADYLSYAAFGAPTHASLTGGTNFAFGGARGAEDDQISPGVAIPGLQTQLGMYLASTGGAVDPDALYVINFGNNDVDAIESGDTEGLTIPQYFDAYANTMAGSVAYLSAHGATNILLLGVPNPLDPVGVALEAQLDATLDFIEPSLSANLYRFDYFSFFTALAANPAAFGLPADLDFGSNCQAEVPNGPGMDCSHYFSFDGTHPTTAVDYALARTVAAQIGLPAVPEPANWTLMIAGFGFAGATLRRRRSGYASA